MDVVTSRQLEQYVIDHADVAESHFVLAYHYLTCNHTDSAEGQLLDVIRLKPQEPFDEAQGQP